MSHREKVFAVFDISSSSVGGAHVLQKYDRTCPATIMLATARKESVVHDDIDVARFVSESTHRLQEVVETIKSVDPHHPSDIQVVLASPWYSSQTRTITYTKPQPFVCTKKLIESLITAEVSHALKDAQGLFGPDAILIEQHIAGIKLNGYHTQVPYGKKVTSLECSLIMTTASKSVLVGFRDTLHRAYGDRPVRFTTSAIATFVVMRDRTKHLDDAVVIDIGEEITDVAFVRQGVILSQHSFPVGTYALYRAVTKHATEFIHEAGAILESYRLGKLTSVVRRKVDRAIAQYSEEWQKGFQGVVEQGSYGLCLPAHILVTVDTRFELLVSSMIENDPFVTYRCGTDTLSLVHINESVLASSVGTVDYTLIDSPLATAALYAERLL